MSHKYFCTHCGRELTQDTVLFDMQYLLTGNAKERFDILSFRLTKAELEGLVASGTRGDMNYTHYELSLTALLEYMGNDNNLKAPVIRNLTMDDIKDYVQKVAEQELATNKADEPEEDNELAALLSDLGVTNAPAEEETQEEEQEEEWPEAIAALLAKDTANVSRSVTKGKLRHDLDILRQLFGDADSYRLEIFLLSEEDDSTPKQKVLYGYRANTGVGAVRRKTTVENARVCCHCGRKVFEHAGTAEHRTVAFIGDQKAGKTSTILALTNYVLNGLLSDRVDHPIWNSAKTVKSVAFRELLNKDDERLINDLNLYEQGLPPGKTHASRREDAYSATFRFQNKVQPDKYYILTLIDLPGELCDPKTGRIDVDNLTNNFPVALACEMFILCFDATTAIGTQAGGMVDNVCKWASQFQDIRQEYWKNAVAAGIKESFNNECFAPVMILYTKCPELENPGDKIKMPAMADLIKASYIFRQERHEIDRTQVYKAVGSQFEKYDNLKNVYVSRLRCSPYGFAAGLVEPQLPRPVHVDDLMRWILSVTGCIDPEAKYYPDLVDRHTVLEKSNNFIVRPQYRAQVPAGAGSEGDLREALNRCFLFENPGVVDTALVSSYDNWAELLKIRGAIRIGRKNY